MLPSEREAPEQKLAALVELRKKAEQGSWQMRLIDAWIEILKARVTNDGQN
jgi:hypothetical protein